MLVIYASTMPKLCDQDNIATRRSDSHLMMELTFETVIQTAKSPENTKNSINLSLTY